jgi:tetratricopeptide (TPR) repeat protein
VHQDTANYQAAEANHREALAWRATGDRLAEAVSLTDLGLVQQFCGDYQAAIAGYEAALPLFRSLNSQFDVADVLSELGMAWRLTGDYEAAAACERQALDLFHNVGDRLGQAWALNELRLVQQLTGDYQAAAASVAEAIELFPRPRRPPRPSHGPEQPRRAISPNRGAAGGP